MIEIFLNMKKIFKQQFHYDKGFSSLISVLIVGAIGVSVTTMLMLLGVSSIKSSIVGDEGDRARFMADTCAEEALQKLLEDTSYIGGESLSLDGLTCDILTVGGTGNTNRTVQAESTVGNATRRVVVEIDTVQPRIILTSWQEVGNF